jgi:Outer membrane protein beta-barrel domain
VIPLPIFQTKKPIMKTKIAIVSLLTVLLISHARAQNGVSFGIRAGINFQNLTGKDEGGDKYSNKLKTGFHIGGNAEILVAPDFYLQPGLLFSTKGARYKNIDRSINLSYIEIPVNFIYKPVLGEGKLLLGVGPYAAFAVGGKFKSGGVSSDINFGSNAGDDIKRFDAGGNFLVGYELSNHLSAQLNAGLGLVNIGDRQPGDSKSSLSTVPFKLEDFQLII